MVCLKCKYETDNHQSFSSHIHKAHGITSQNYYDTYLKKEVDGICKTCGKQTQFKNMWVGYRKFCCRRCISINNDVKQQKINTSLKHYGTEYPAQSKVIKEQMAKTNFERYGATNIFSSEYGKQKCKEVWKQKYGVDNPMKCKEIREKLVNTCMKRFNTRSPLESIEVQNTIKQTLLNRYGVEHSSQIPSSRAKAKETNRKRFGVDCVLQLDRVRKKIYKTAYTSKARSKAAKTRQLNGNRSSLETLLEDFFIQNNIPHELEYNKDTRYPYMCDFYLPNTDTFIEINGYWVHGGHFFNESDKDDQKLLKEWESKNTPQYLTAIKIWTQRDLEKRNCAIQNNLNYIVLWNKEDVINYINSFNL